MASKTSGSAGLGLASIGGPFAAIGQGQLHRVSRCGPGWFRSFGLVTALVQPCSRNQSRWPFLGSNIGWQFGDRFAHTAVNA